MVTAGPTFEPIDPVRFIGNHSSGKMGFELAKALADQGAEVVLVSGPVSLEINHPSIQRINVTTAKEMYDECIKYFPKCNGAILCAAVADFTPESTCSKKIKRKGDLDITLKPTKDIALSLGEIKNAEQVLVGFALETDDEHENARRKLVDKNLDFIVLNSMNEAGAGFKINTNKISIIEKSGDETNYGIKRKNEVAVDIVDKFITYFK